MKYLLSMDGGGSKTAWLLTDENGNSCAELQSESCSHLDCGFDEAMRRIKSGIGRVLDLGNILKSDLAAAAFGVPCFGEYPSLDDTIERELKEHLPSCAVSVFNDVELGFAGSLCLEDGIHMVAGTGAIAIGKSGGSAARSNGWHPEFSDEGSGFWLGMKTLGLFAKQADGRAPKSALYRIMKKELSLGSDSDIIDYYAKIPKGERKRIAALQLLLKKAADAGDADALKLFCEGANELYLSVLGVYRTLDFPKDRELHVSYSGGLFARDSYVLKPFCELVSSLPAKVTPPCLSPTEGGILLAANSLSPEKAEALSKKLKENIKEV